MIVAEIWVRTFKTAKRELTGVLAGKLDGRVTHVCDALAVLLVAQVHAVCVSITAPSHRNTQTVHSALELICVATAGRPRGCRQMQKGHAITIQPVWTLAQRHRHISYYLMVMRAWLPDVENQFPGMEVVTSVRYNHNELIQSKLSHEQRSRAGTVTAIIRHQTLRLSPHGKG